jgi:ubiquinone/menaquinone biosynthesis C-methylase UbiE
VVSNGSLQWFSDIDKTLADIARILSPRGIFHCSIFGPGSLLELASGLQAVLGPGEGLAAEAFPRPESLRSALDTYYKDGKIEQELFEKTYRSAFDLLLHIKKTGTAGWQQKLQHPLTPSRVARLDAWFDRTYGACRVTYQVLYLQGSR